MRREASIIPGASLALVFDTAKTTEGVFEPRVFIPIRNRAGQLERWVKKGWVVATMFERVGDGSKCTKCDGHGMLRVPPDPHADPYLLGSVVSGSRDCPQCEGTGKSTPPFYALTDAGAQVANDAAMIATLEDLAP